MRKNFILCICSSGIQSGQVDKFRLVVNTSILTISVPGNYSVLFVDINENLYCSTENIHQVFKKYLGDDITILTTVAEDGSSGSTANTLTSESPQV